MRRRRRRARFSPPLGPGSDIPTRRRRRPDRLILAIDNLDALSPGAAIAWIEAAQNAIGPGCVGLLAFDPARLAATLGGPRKARRRLGKWLQVAVNLPARDGADGERVVARLLPTTGQPSAAPDAKLSAALVEPLSSAETSLLAALAPLAADLPRDAKRFVSAYRLARCSGSSRPVMALMQAVAFADDDAQAAMRDRLAKGSGELGDVGGRKTPSPQPVLAEPRSPSGESRLRVLTACERRATPSNYPEHNKVDIRLSDLISVVVCSYNPRPEYMRRVMAALRAQILPLEKWELLLIDNASTNPLSATWDLSWHPSARHVREDEQGLSFARRRGICEARGDVIVFVDDDNVVAPDYLFQVEAIMQDTSIGAAGGAAVPVFEENVSPPAHFYSYAGYFACGVQCGVDGISGGLVDPRTGVLFGAGLAVRRRDMLDLLDLPNFPLFSGRKGTSLSSGEDIEICHLIALKGQRLVYTSALKLEHLISESRLSPSYIERAS